MRFKLLCLFILLMIATTCFAQRYSDARNVNLSGQILKNGYGIVAGYEQLFGKNWNAFLVDVEYMNRSENLRVKDYKATLLNLNIIAGYRRYLSYNDFHPYFSIKGFIGHESFTNKKDMPESVILDRKNGVQYGAGLDIGAEYSLKKISFMGAYNPKYEFRNTEFISSFQFGVKYYF
ncbi:MAG: hypothetical protein ACK5MK_06850 [Dysgonomonas sp.]